MGILPNPYWSDGNHNMSWEMPELNSHFTLAGFVLKSYDMCPGVLRLCMHWD